MTTGACPRTSFSSAIAAPAKRRSGGFLAERLDWSYADVDDRIEAVAGKTIAEIFVAEGEISFRDREAAFRDRRIVRPVQRA